MNISRFLLATGTAVVLVVPFQAMAGPDSAAQAKMREALRQKMEELNAAETPAPAPPAPVVVEPSPVVPPPPAPVPAVIKSEPVAVPTKTVVVPVPVVAAPAVVVEKSETQFTPVPSDDSDARAKKIEEALRQKVAEMNAAGAKSAPTPPPAATKPKPQKPSKPAAKPEPKVVAAPAPAPVVQPAPAVVKVEAPKAEVPKLETPVAPLTGSKENRLAELLRRYKADEITAQDYHSQRAAIIAEH